MRSRRQREGRFQNDEILEKQLGGMALVPYTSGLGNHGAMAHSGPDHIRLVHR